jgi:hypothetical protein
LVRTPGKRPLITLVSVGTAGLALRRLGRRSGATDEELGARLPGDELVPDPLWDSTRAVTVSAPPASVWPWIVQMGYPAYRAGWYTPHWLDRLQWGIRQRSADRILPELQELKVGDRIPDSRDWSVFFTVAALEPERALILYSTRHILKPMRAVAFSWVFVVQPVDGRATRLILRARARCAPRWSWLILWPLFSLGDFVNATAMLSGIKARVERPTQMSVPDGDHGAHRRQLRKAV